MQVPGGGLRWVAGKGGRAWPGVVVPWHPREHLLLATLGGSTEGEKGSGDLEVISCSPKDVTGQELVSLPALLPSQH